MREVKATRSVSFQTIGRESDKLIQASPMLIHLLSQRVADNALLLKYLCVIYVVMYYVHLLLALCALFSPTQKQFEQLQTVRKLGLKLRWIIYRLCGDMFKNKVYTLLAMDTIPFMTLCVHQESGFGPQQYSGQALENEGFAVSKQFAATQPRPITSVNVDDDNYMTQIADRYTIKEWGREDLKLIDFSSDVTCIKVKQEQEIDIMEMVNKLYFDNLESNDDCTDDFKSLVANFKKSIDEYDIYGQRKYAIMDEFVSLNSETKRLLKIKREELKEDDTTSDDGSTNDDGPTSDDSDHESSSSEEYIPTTTNSKKRSMRNHNVTTNKRKRKKKMIII